MSNKLRYSLTGMLILGTIGTIGYKNNWLAVHDSVARYQSEHTPVVSNNHLSISKRESIVERLMKQTHANEGLTKQGFVSMPTVGILQPIFDNSYTNVGLNAGANYTNRSEVDPDGKNKLKMGVGNYGLASHNFNDGITGFSVLQEKLNDDAPYLQDGQLKGSDWLNGQHVY